MLYSRLTKILAMNTNNNRDINLSLWKEKNGFKTILTNYADVMTKAACFK